MKQRLEEQLTGAQDRHMAVVQALEAQQSLTHMSETASQQSLLRLRAMSERCDSLVLHNRRLLCEIHSLTNRLQQGNKSPKKLVRNVPPFLLLCLGLLFTFLFSVRLLPMSKPTSPVLLPALFSLQERNQPIFPRRETAMQIVSKPQKSRSQNTL